MKTLSSLICAIFFPLFLLAQTEPPPTAPYIRYGDLYYQNQYRGLKQLMKDLPRHDSVLYSKLRLEWEQMQTNQVLGIVSCTAGSLVGLAVMNSASDNQTSSSNRNASNVDGRIVFGSLLLLGGLGGGFALLNLRRDVLNFVNLFNDQSEGQKLRFTLTPAAGPGVGLQYRLH